jgi:hypothetical protein
MKQKLQGRPPKGSIRGRVRRIGGKQFRKTGRFRSTYEKILWDALAKMDFRQVQYEEIKLPYIQTKPIGKFKYACARCGSNEVGYEGVYTPDFIINGNIILEAKGVFSVKDRKKMLAVRAAHPEYVFHLQFMYDNWLWKNRKTKKYSDWAKENGFQYGIGMDLNHVRN